MISFAQSTLWIELIVLLISSIFYYLQIVQNRSLYQKVARISYYCFTIITSIASFFLMYFILTHNFRLEYVFAYSSKDLPLRFLISSFWAGQEGSFLLWVLLSAWLGVFLIKFSKKNEAHTLLIYNLQNLFLAVLLLKQSPFRLTDQLFNDGYGLNMLLQDPWMVIHPPIVFLGYAAYGIPFAIAIASLWKRDYSYWIKNALPWITFAFVTLGAGIIIGGIWSYKVLGWGGYWGWDPVENASLLPWLSGIALLHGMILQKSTNRMARTNYFLTVLSFILVIYSTFLTRSGVLANFSVHSFTDLGISGWLVFFIFIFIAISVYFIISRYKEIPSPNPEKQNELNFFSIEFGLIAAVILLFLSALLTGLGTSAPLITRLTGNPSKVSTDFYVNVNLPIAILIGLFLCYIPLLKWGKNNTKKILPKLISGIVVSVIFTIVTFFNGFPGIFSLLLIIFSGFAVGINLELFIRLIKKNIISSSAAIAHLGLGFMFIAFVISSVYDKSERISIFQDESRKVFGFEVKFLEAQYKNESKGARLYLPVEIKKGNYAIYGQPDIYIENKGNGNRQQFHHPFILRGLWSDLYISPEGYTPAEVDSGHTKHLVIRKGETITVNDYKITFEKYDLMNMDSNSGSIAVGADLSVSYKNKPGISLKPVYIVNDENNPQSQVKLPYREETYLTLTGINASDKSIELHYYEPAQAKQSSAQSKPATIHAEISVKPGMTLLWTGVLFLLIGGIFSIFRRWPQNAKGR